MVSSAASYRLEKKDAILADPCATFEKAAALDASRDICAFCLLDSTLVFSTCTRAHMLQYDFTSRMQNSTVCHSQFEAGCTFASFDADFRCSSATERLGGRLAHAINPRLCIM